jgi:polysaccharide biosynthesis/export protein
MVNKTLLLRLTAVFFVFSLLLSCGGPTGEVVRVITVEDAKYKGLGEEEIARLEELRKAEEAGKENSGIKKVIKATPNYTVDEYLKLYPKAASAIQDYRVGGYDMLNITVYEEEDLSRENVRVSGEGYISFPLIGRLRVDEMTTSEIENLISRKLAEGQFLLDAHVSVTVADFKSKNFLVLGSVKEPGSYSLQAQQRVLDAISRAGGVDFEQGGKQGMIIRSLHPNTPRETKIVIRFDLPALLKGGDQTANLPLQDKDLLYIPKAENFYIIGQVEKPGSYQILEKDVTLVEAISMAGGFTPIAARNKTRIIRVENGVEKIYEIQVDAITKAGKKGLDLSVKAGDVIIVPESFF